MVKRRYFYGFFAAFFIGFALITLMSFADSRIYVSNSLLNANVDAQTTDSSNWRLVWADEFDGNELDRTKWTPETSCWGGGNNERQCYTDRPENITVHDGILYLTAQEELYSGLEFPQDFKNRGKTITQSYTSGKVRTKGLASWKYGRFEARLKLPQGQGTWPAFWMMSETDKYGKWPLSGEIDIVESVNLGAACSDCVGNDIENRTIAALHFGEQWPSNAFKSIKTPLVNKDDFNKYAVEWTKNKIVWFVNDKEVFSMLSDEWFTATVDKSENPYAPFDQPFYLMLNLAVGGNLSLNNNEKKFDPNSYPNALLVDWVRVYQCKEIGQLQSCSFE